MHPAVITCKLLTIQGLPKSPETHDTVQHAAPQSLTRRLCKAYAPQTISLEEAHWLGEPPGAAGMQCQDEWRKTTHTKCKYMKRSLHPLCARGFARRLCAQNGCIQRYACFAAALQLPLPPPCPQGMACCDAVAAPQKHTPHCKPQRPNQRPNQPGLMCFPGKHRTAKSVAESNRLLTTPPTPGL